ncbi:MAG TPA: hypothetical protein VKP64_04390 [Mycobacteriales bacterium]|nr:hypothetical protein [Mycobacteriales bacterium]
MEPQPLVTVKARLSEYVDRVHGQQEREPLEGFFEKIRRRAAAE